jgi:hypothetical protein
MGNKDSFARYQEQSLHVQVRIPFIRRAVGVVMETPGGQIARLMREDQARLEATREQDLAAGRQAAYEFWEGMRLDGVNAGTSRLAPHSPAQPAGQPGPAAAVSRTSPPAPPGPQLNAEIPGARVHPVIAEIEPG